MPPKTSKNLVSSAQTAPDTARRILRLLQVALATLLVVAIPRVALADPIFTPLFTALFTPVFGIGTAATSFAVGLASAVATTSVSYGDNRK